MPAGLDPERLVDLFSRDKKAVGGITFVLDGPSGVEPVKVTDTVLGGFGWQRFSSVKPAGLQKIDPKEAPLSASLGVLGMPGLTAWVGLEDIGMPKAGETMVVSAASGAVAAAVSSG